MPPKQKADEESADLTSEQKQALAESKRLLTAAFESSGTLSKARRMSANQVPVSKLLIKANGKDIVKKSTVRKGRYLLNINAKLAPAAAGKLGTLAQLDSKNPVLYVDFPNGRLKFFGTLVFPKNKYMVLKLGSKDILCEDVLENMIVFSEAWWIGQKEDNPDEKRLETPPSLLEKRHTTYTFGAQEGGAEAGPILEQADDQEDADLGEEEEEEDKPTLGSQRAQRHQSKRPLYALPESDEDDESSPSQSEEEEVRRLPAPSSAGAAKRPAAAKVGGAQKRAKPSPAEPPKEEKKPKTLKGAAKKQSTMQAFFSAPEKKKSSAAGGEAETSKPLKLSQPKKSSGKKAVVIDLSSDDEIEILASQGGAAPSQTPLSSRPARAARIVAASKLKEVAVPSEDDSDNIEESSSEEDDDDDSSD